MWIPQLKQDKNFPTWQSSGCLSWQRWECLSWQCWFVWHGKSVRVNIFKTYITDFIYWLQIPTSVCLTWCDGASVINDKAAHVWHDKAVHMSDMTKQLLFGIAKPIYTYIFDWHDKAAADGKRPEVSRGIYIYLFEIRSDQIPSLALHGLQPSCSWYKNTLKEYYSHVPFVGTGSILRVRGPT